MALKVELAWDCPYCDTKGIKGRNRECPNCGRPRGDETKFYLPNGQGPQGTIIGAEFGHNIVEESTLKSAKPDWLCDSCGSYNSDAVNVCKSCGAPRHSETMNYAELNRGKGDLSETAKATIRGQANESQRSGEKQSDLQLRDDSTYQEKFRNWVENHEYQLKRGVSIALGILLVSIIVIGLMLFFSQKITITVQELHWKYSIDIEVYKKFRESDWSVPNGGEVVYTQEEVHHYDKIIDHYNTVYVDRSETYLDHYETVAVEKSETYLDHYDTYYEYAGDDGNGYGSVREVRTPVYKTRYYTDYEQKPVYKTRYWQEEKQEPVYRYDPVYRTKYYYDIWRWVYDRTASNQGQKGEKPTFPKPTLFENERFGQKHKQYWVVASVNDKEEVKTYNTTEEIWEQINISDELIVGKYALNISELNRKE